MSEWKAKTVKEAKTSDGVVWRAQTTTAPDGSKFVGVRKFAVKKDGTEVVTKDGLSLVVTDGKVPVDTIRVIIDLLSVFVDSGASEESTFVLRHRVTGKDRAGLRNGKRELLTFTSVAAAKAYRDSHIDEPANWPVKRA